MHVVIWHGTTQVSYFSIFADEVQAFLVSVLLLHVKFFPIYCTLCGITAMLLN
jgi:hypothetical protein